MENFGNNEEQTFFGGEGGSGGRAENFNGNRNLGKHYFFMPRVFGARKLAFSSTLAVRLFVLWLACPQTDKKLGDVLRIRIWMCNGTVRM